MVADCHWAPFMTLKAITCAAAVQEMVACPSVRLGQQAWHHRYSQSQATQLHQSCQLQGT